LDEIGETARIIGAVNAVVFRDGKAVGYNVDGIGFYRSFTERTGRTAQGEAIFVLGAGGASRAVCATLAMEGARRIYICNRTESKAGELAEHINGAVRNCCAAVSWNPGAMEAALADSDALVNTTSVGMYPHGDALCLDAGLLEAAARRPSRRPDGVPGEAFLVCDIVYNPVRTRLLETAENLGCRTLNGLAMLAAQGEESFKLWTGRKPPEGVMRAALERITMP
jgi:shikimate dehydrogenase